MKKLPNGIIYFLTNIHQVQIKESVLNDRVYTFDLGLELRTDFVARDFVLNEVVWT